MWSIIAVASILGAGPLELSTLGDERALASLLWEQSPTLQRAHSRVAEAEAERRKALRFPNPGVEIAVNTLPIGQLNPSDLRDPFLNVPNVAIGFSVLLELGKRELRQEATAQAARAVALDALNELRLEVLELEDVIGDIAAAQARIETLEGLADDASALTSLQEARASRGDTSELDADRARLELENTVTALGEARAQLAERLRQCARAVSAPCVAFSQAEQATRWLDRHAEHRGAEVERRPDLRALEATIAAARAAQRLAANGWIPDPTLRLGYVRDQFVVSGNQQNSLFVGVSMPLPIFAHGQDDAAAAAAAAQSAERARELLRSTAILQRAQLTAELAAVEARQKRLRDQSLPLARGVVDRLAIAVSRGAAPIQELLLARRSLAELLLTATELARTDAHLHVALARLTGSLESLPSP